VLALALMWPGVPMLLVLLLVGRPLGGALRLQ
jgi:hypothetical protein